MSAVEIFNKLCEMKEQDMFNALVDDVFGWDVTYKPIGFDCLQKEYLSKDIINKENIYKLLQIGCYKMYYDESLPIAKMCLLLVANDKYKLFLIHMCLVEIYTSIYATCESRQYANRFMELATSYYDQLKPNEENRRVRIRYKHIFALYCEKRTRDEYSSRMILFDKTEDIYKTILDMYTQIPNQNKKDNYRIYIDIARLHRRMKKYDKQMVYLCLIKKYTNLNKF